MANRFAVANGNWNDTSTWSATSGGAPGASVPIAGDVVDLNGHIVTIPDGVSVACATCAITAAASRLRVLGGTSGTFTGNITADESLAIRCGDGSDSALLRIIGNVTISDSASGTAIQVSSDPLPSTFTITGNLTVGDMVDGAVIDSGPAAITITGNVTAKSPLFSLHGSDGNSSVTIGGTVTSQAASITSTPLIVEENAGTWNVTIGNFVWESGGTAPFLGYSSKYSITDNFTLGSTLGTFDLPATTDVRSGTTFAGGTMVGELSAGGGGGGSLRMGL